MKKTLLATCILSFISANASNFNVIIDQESNSYDSGVLVVEDSGWIASGVESCSFDVNDSEIYYNIDFTQVETCQQNFEKTITTKKVISDGTEIIVDINKQTKTESSSTTAINKGTHLEGTCEDIKTFNTNLPDGEYVISQSGNPTVYCDMTKNGGGWMRVSNYDWYSDKTSPNSDFDSTSGKIIRDTQNIDRLLMDAFWVKDWTTSAGTTGQRWASVDVQPLYNWSKAMIEFEGLAFRSLDGYHPASGLSNNVQGQYIDGFSFTFGANNARTHMHSVPAGHGTDSSVKDAYLDWLSEDSLDYMDQSDIEAGYTYNAMDSFNINYSGKTPSKDVISMRLMADQYFNDETIGFRKLIIWVK